MRGERAGKHVYFARLPASQRLHHPAHLKNQPNTTKKRASSGSAARRRGASCAPALRPNHNARGTALAATSVAFFLRVVAPRAPVFDAPRSIYGPTQCHNRSPSPSCRPTAQVPAAQNVPCPSEAPTAAVLGGDTAPGCRTISPNAGTAAACRPIDRLDVLWSGPCGSPKRGEKRRKTRPRGRARRGYLVLGFGSPRPRARFGRFIPYVGQV